jgi:hypothetical protein
MAFQEQIAKLVERLTKLSRDGKVDWEETAVVDTFQALVSKFVVTVAKAGSHADADYRFTVLDQAGKVIEEAVISKYDDDVVYTPPHKEWLTLHQLHDLARRHALHTDEALSDLLSSLEEIR